MISGVLLVLIGEAVVLGSPPLLAWFLLFFAANALWMPLVEEPALERRFGEDYLRYKHLVPRWIPRRH
jgi:protein-S-isoprenylcysteine O-methyltransferase Ste14